ncbi:MAG: HAMP domain-containing histidine kinase [Prevotella sp.]|nr:HAMP domain-containing histidine kinase [Prevotella sp.]
MENNKATNVGRSDPQPPNLGGLEIGQLKQQLQQQEKLASLGMLSAGIAHEIQNPLNFVINFSKMSERLLSDLTAIVEDNAKLFSDTDREDLTDIVDSLKENMQQIVENSERAVSIIQSILLISRGKENERIPSDVCRIVREYVRLSYHAMRASHQGFNVTLHETYQEGMPPVMVIPQDLSRAVLNVTNNAFYAVWRMSQAAPEGYSPEINISVALSADNQLVISIADNGEGMTDEVKQHLFENFFTTKPIGQGTGLGMGITREIIENKHGGKVTFTSTLGKGTTFTFTIPVVRPSA